MVCTKETVKTNGLNIWSDEAAAGYEPKIDIIGVQGLGAHPFDTWVKKAPSPKVSEQKLRNKVQFWKSKKPRGNDGENSSTECLWLRDLLVPLFNARIATYSYESRWLGSNTKTSLRECAEQFLNVLSQHRQHANECQRPLILIGHSLGSLVIQQALVIAVHQQEFANLRLSVAGIIFLGAPFQGSDVANFGKWLARFSGGDPTLLEYLNKDNPSLYAISRDFWGSYKDWDFVCFYEKIGAEYGPIRKHVVDHKSASLLGKRMMFLNTDHSGLNKFSGKDDENFLLVLPELQRMVDGGGSIVADRHNKRDIGAVVQANVHWRVPRAVSSLFIGRTELLLRIQNTLRYDRTLSTKKQRRFVITGLGGQGKSEVCLQVASLMREEFWGVFWVDVDKKSTTERDFIAIAKILGHLVDSVHEALQILAAAKQSWLLILDNADDPNFDYQDYLPSGTHGAVIITSRVAECKRYSPDAFEAIQGLEDQESKELLLKAAEVPNDLWLTYDDQAEEVVRLLGSHTLALIQAGAYIAQGHSQLHEYPRVYQQQRGRLMKYHSKQAQSRYCDVYATFEASADVLEQSSNEAAKDALCLLAILAMLDSSVLPLQIFLDAWDGCRAVRAGAKDFDKMSQSHVSQLPGFMAAEDDEWDSYRLVEASSLLVSLSLINRHNLDSSLGLSMHPLTHAWAKDRQTSKQQGLSWITAGCVLGFSRQNADMWRIQERRLLPHVLSFLEIEVNRVYSFASRAIVTPILLKCGWALEYMRQDSRLGSFLEDIFLQLGEDPEEPSEQLLPLYDLQVRSLYNLGKIRREVALLERVVKLKKKTLAEDDPDLLYSQHVLAIAYQANGQVKEAIQILEQVVQIEETLAKDHPDRLASQHVLARAYLANGQVKEAIQILEQVVQIQETTLAKDHPNQLNSQHELARAYLANGQVKEAIQILEQVVQIKETLAKDHPNRLHSQHELARAYQANGQVKEAIQILEQVVQIEETLAKDHPSRLASQHTLAIAYQANGQVKEAIQILEQVVQIRETTLAKDHPDRLASQHELARAYEANGQVKEAVALLEQVVQIKRLKYHEGHPSRVVSEEALRYCLNRI